MGLVEIVSAIGNSVSTVGRGASSVGRISAEVPVSTATISGLGRLSALGSRMSGPILPVVNEGPVIGGLEMFKPIGQINFNKGIEVPKVFQRDLANVILDPTIEFPAPQAEGLTSEIVEAPKITAVAEAGINPVNIEPQSSAKVEAIQVSDALKLAAVRETISLLGANQPQIAVEPVVVPQIEPGFLSPFIPAPALESVIKPKSVLSTQVVNQPQVETKAAQAVQTSLEPVLEEQQIEELVEEEVAVANDDAQIRSEDAEDIKELKIQRVVDEPVMKQREHEIISAVRLASDEIAQGIGKDANTDVEISGETVGEFLPAQHKGNRSGELNIVDPDEKILDGTLIATFKDIVSVKFNSVVDAIKRVPKIVAKHRPVTRGEGQLVTDEDVAKVYLKYKGRIPPAQEVIKRVIRMVKQVKVVKRGQNPVQIIPIQEEVIESNEGALQSQSDLAAALLVPASYNI